MSVESATYINSLNASYPAATDPKSEGDDHLRLIKSAVKATFPSITGAVSATQLEINQLRGITSGVVSKDDVQTLTNKTFTGYAETVYAVSGTTPVLSPVNGTIQTWTLSGNSTPTAGAWSNGQSITLMVDDGTAYTITWTSLAVNWKTDTGSAPSLNTTGYTAIQLWKVGGTVYGARVGNN